MAKKIKIIINILVLLITSAICLYLFKNKLYTYLIIFITLDVILLLLLISTIFKKSDERSQYEYKLKSMIKKFDSILVETSTIPDLEGKNIMLITNIEDMIDAAVEIRKPIYYKNEENDCIFILLDNQDTCIYILKVTDEEIPIEKFIKDRKQTIENLIDEAKEQQDIEGIINDTKNKSSSKNKQKNKKYENDIL